jgi:hypothetical protein
MKEKFLFILTIIVLSSCNGTIHTNTIIKAKIDIGDGGLLSQKPCGPPCFYGMIPSITTTDQAQTILKDMVLEQYCTIFGDLTEPGIRGLECQGIVNVGIKESSDYVEFIGYFPSITITVGEVIDKYGEPNSISKSLLSRNDFPFIWKMVIYYNDIKMDVHLEKQKGNTYKLEYGTKIIVIGYNDEISYYSLIEGNSAWHGYGEY